MREGGGGEGTHGLGARFSWRPFELRLTDTFYAFCRLSRVPSSISNLGFCGAR